MDHHGPGDHPGDGIGDRPGAGDPVGVIPIIMRTIDPEDVCRIVPATMPQQVIAPTILVRVIHIPILAIQPTTITGHIQEVIQPV